MCDRLVAAFTLLLIFGGVDVPSAAAQWWIDAAVGGASLEAVTAHVDTNSALMAIRRDGTTWMQLAGGLPLGSEGSSWGSFAGGTESLLPGPVTFGGRAGAQGYLYSTDAPDSDGWGAIAEAGPLVRFGWARTDVELRLGGIASRTVIDGDTDSRFLLSNVAQVGMQMPAGVHVDAAAQYVLTEDSGFPLIAATLSQGFARGGWWGRFGHWFSDDVEQPEWSVGVYANAGERFQINALFRQETNDPIYQRQPRKSWSLGLSMAVGRQPPSVRVDPIIFEGRRATVRVPVAEATTAPMLAGDFNSWKPAPMALQGDFWIASVDAPSGVYRFSFRKDDGTWFLPSNVMNRVDDGFGGENGILVVP